MGGAVYLATVNPVVCECPHSPKQLFKAATLERAIQRMAGYWNVYLTFYGEQTYWLEFSIVDVRDGCLMWRNGQTIKEEKDSGTQDRQGLDSVPGPGPRLGRWLVSGQPVDRK